MLGAVGIIGGARVGVAVLSVSRAWARTLSRGPVRLCGVSRFRASVSGYGRTAFAALRRWAAMIPPGGGCMSPGVLPPLVWSSRYCA